MKQLLYTFLFCLSFHENIAQENDTFTISLANTTQPEKLALPFSVIHVIDARFDKSNIGCVVKDLSFKGMTKNKLAAVFPDSLHTYLPVVLSKLFSLDKSGSDTLIMLVKQFRIADHLSNTLDTYHRPETLFTLSASFYKKESNKLLKISSINNTWAKEWTENVKENANQQAIFRNEAIVALFFKAFSNLDWTPTQTAFLWTEMESGIEKRFRLPLYTDPVLKAGIYKTFDEFRNNSPSLVRVHLGMKDNELVQVLDENNNPISLKDYWGACDGTHRYVIFRGALHKLTSSDRSFKFLSYRQEAKNRRTLGTSVTRVLLIGPQTRNKKPGSRVQPEFFYLNMDNGQIHLEELIGAENYEKAIRKLSNNIH